MSFMNSPDTDDSPISPLNPIRNLLERTEAVRKLTSELRGFSRLPSAASRSDIEALVEHQLKPWRNVRLQHSSLIPALRSLNKQSWTTFIIRIKGRKISIWKKYPLWRPAPQKLERKRQMRNVAYRLAIYRAMLQEVINQYNIDADVTLALDVDDRGTELTDAPVFTFQKHESSRNVLMPDIDFFRLHWYTWLHDERSYDQKEIKAVFAGSSTGGVVSERVIANQALPRLRSAAHFVGNPLVNFKITKAVQCETDAAAALLKQQPYFGPWMSWHEQLRHRFLFSLDGNGAACARLAIGFKSNSAVIKFHSPFMLYYFPAMAPGREYIEVENEQQAEDVIKAEISSPGRFRSVSEAGRAFAERYFNVASMLDYMALLLAGYARIYRQ
jgi:hypothetical protein